MVSNNAWMSQVQQWIERDYPNLSSTGYEITSPDTIDYNCIAWAAEETEEWWWPDAQNQHYWPPGVSREETLDAFTKAYQTLGYQVCDDSNLEEGFQKIAIYVLDGKPKHAARQLPNGKWTSKLGPDEDIEHDALEGLEGELYGKVTRVMKRSMSQND